MRVQTESPGCRGGDFESLLARAAFMRSEFDGDLRQVDVRESTDEAKARAVFSQSRSVECHPYRFNFENVTEMALMCQPLIKSTGGLALLGQLGPRLKQMESRGIQPDGHRQTRLDDFGEKLSEAVKCASQSTHLMSPFPYPLSGDYSAFVAGNGTGEIRVGQRQGLGWAKHPFP
jgi:hypothetical protein